MRIYLGGGGSADDEAVLWEEFLSPGMRIVYWPFALAPDRHADALHWLEGSLAAHGQFQVSMWSGLAGHAAADLATADLLFIGGGNTYALLDEVRRHGYELVVRDYLTAGGALYGGSAGAILAGADISIAAGMDADHVGIDDTTGLDLLGGLVVRPHYTVGEADVQVRAWARINRQTVLGIPERAGVAVIDGVARNAGPEPAYLINADDGPQGLAAGESWQV